MFSRARKGTPLPRQEDEEDTSLPSRLESRQQGTAATARRLGRPDPGSRGGRAGEPLLAPAAPGARAAGGCSRKRLSLCAPGNDVL